MTVEHDLKSKELNAVQILENDHQHLLHKQLSVTKNETHVGKTPYRKDTSTISRKKIFQAIFRVQYQNNQN